MYCRLIIFCALAATIGLVDASAQSRSDTGGSSPSQTSTEPGASNRTRLMLGINVGETVPLDDSLTSRTGVGFQWRWRSRHPETHDGFALSYRLGAYTAPYKSDVIGQQMAVGDVRLRPITVGADYKMPRGKWTWSVGATAGWSLNKLHTTQAFRERLAGTTHADVITDITNNFAWSPRFKGWYDINRRISVLVESSYNYARPRVTIRSGGLDLGRTLNADALIFRTGIVYGIW